MVWHIKKTSILGGSRTVYYKGNNSWTETYAVDLLTVLKQRQKQNLTSGKRKQLQVGTLLLSTKTHNVYLFIHTFIICKSPTSDVCSSASVGR